MWHRELDIYGAVRSGDSQFIPFLYQGQYFDVETGLAYNRFRYYSPDTGMYISQDPIRLAGGMSNMYSYVIDSVTRTDPFGLSDNPLVGIDLRNMNRSQIEDTLAGNNDVVYRGGPPNKSRMSWNYKDTGDYVARIDPPDKITKYDHIHLYDKSGNPLDINGNIVPRDSPDAHIKIKCN